MRSDHLAGRLGALLLAATLMGACGAGTTPSPAAQPDTTLPPATTAPPTGISALTVQSNPVGAAVETGIQCVNDIVTPGTGRSLGTTPVIESPISSKDLAECPSGVFALYTNVTLDGYYPHMDVLGFGSSRDNLEPRVYTIEITLNPL